jgi:hypothetical protein
MVKLIVEDIPMFWHTLIGIPKGVLEKIRKKVSYQRGIRRYKGFI